MRKAFVFAAASVAALGLASMALSKAPGTKPEERVYGGYHSEGLFSGSGALPIPPRDASVDAHRDTVNGKTFGTFRLGRNDTAEFLLEARITCVSIVGNRAVLGGVITVDNTPTPTVGEDFLWHAVDNGGPGASVRDRVSAVWKDAEGSLGQGAFPGTLPAGWPQTCPAADAAIAADTFVGNREVQGGDIVVVAAG